MASMHSRDKGKSGATKPSKKSITSWVRYSDKEVEMLVLKLAKEGKSTSEIGVILRDSYGIPDVRVATKKKISQILEENKMGKTIPDDLMALIKRNIAVRKHLEANHKDQTAKRGLELTESKIRKLIKYYKKTKKLPADWKFQPERIKLYVE